MPKSAKKPQEAQAAASSKAPEAVHKHNEEHVVDPLEVKKLKEEVVRLTEAKRVSDGILTGLAAQDWDFLVKRATAMKESFNNKMDTFLTDVAALCEVSRRHKERAVGKAPGTEKKHGREKVFEWRESMLNVMFRTTAEFRTVYHIFFAILIIFTCKTMLNEYYKEDGRIITLEMLRWNFAHLFDQVLPLWLGMYATMFITVPLMWIWRRNFVGDIVYWLLYAVLQSVFLAGYGAAIWRLKLPIASAMICLCEQVRMVMKMHAFIRESYKLRHTKRQFPGKSLLTATSVSSVEEEQTRLNELNHQLLPSLASQLRAYFLFTWVPTLIYRNAYPRTPQRKWGVVALNLIEAALCIFYTYTIFATFCVPEFENTAQHLGDVRTLVLSVFNSMLPSILVYLLAFFGLLHAWFNAFAELTRFADRQFYQDWWNSTTFSVYYRKWNMVVHDWLYNYLYMDALVLGKTGAMLSTFIVSALVHEYIIAVAMGFLYPVLFVMFLGVGVLYVKVTEMFRASRFSNTFFWTNLIIGNGLLMVLYSREWYARAAGSPLLTEESSQSFLPYSWQPFFVASPSTQ